MWKHKLKSVLHFIRESLGKLGFRYTRFLLFERIMDERIPAIKTKIPVIVKRAFQSEIQRLPINENELIKRSGDICFIATSPKGVIGYLWVTLKKSAYIPAIEKTRNFKKDQAYVYDARIFQKMRGRNFSEKMLDTALHFLKSKNINKVYAFTDVSNTPTQKGLERLGFYPIKAITYIRVLSFKRYREKILR